MFDFLLQVEGLIVPKNASNTQQFQDHRNIFDAMDIQLSTPTRGKRSAGSKIAASLDKPGMFCLSSQARVLVSYL